MDIKVYHTRVGIVSTISYLYRKVEREVCMGRYENSLRRLFMSWPVKKDVRS